MGLTEAIHMLCTAPPNITCSRKFKSVTANVILYMALMTGILLATCGNLVVIIAISHFKQLHTPTNILTLSLAATDFIIGIFIMPLRTVKTMDTCWYFGDFICMAEILGFPTLTTVSVFHLIFLAMDRYFVVCYPLLYSTKFPIKRALVCVAICWLCPPFYIVLLMYFYFGYIYSSGDFCNASCHVLTTYMLVIVDFLLTFLLPCCSMLGLYCKILIVAIQHAMAIQAMKSKVNFSGKSQVRRSDKGQNKATITISIVILTFIVCLLPFYLCQLLYDVVGYNIIVQVMEFIALFNFSFNPVIYGLFYPWFRKAFILIVTCKIFKKSSSLMNVCSVHH